MGFRQVLAYLKKQRKKDDIFFSLNYLADRTGYNRTTIGANLRKLANRHEIETVKVQDIDLGNKGKKVWRFLIAYRGKKK